MRRRVIVVLLGTAFACATAAPASADQEITAGPGQRYNNPEITIAQGERLTFSNSDIAMHDVTATTIGPDSKPLFATPLIGSGESAFVEGSQYLTTGAYPFVCSIHANMTGTINVSGAGTPVARPGVGGAAADTTAPKVSLAVKTGTVRKARADKAVTIVATLDESATVTAKLVVADKTIATLRQTVGPGATKLRLKLGASARKQMRAGRSLIVRVTASDAAGNRAKATGRRKLK